AAAWPRAVPFGGLLGTGVDEDSLADLLASLFWNGVVDLHAQPPLCTETVSILPRTSALARRQAAAGLLVTNQRRRVLKLDDPVARVLLRHLDGTRTRDDLVRLLDA